MDERPIDELAALVVQRFDRARNAKTPHYSDMKQCLDMMHGRPLSPPKGDGPDIVMDITSPVVKGIIGLIRDILVGSTAAPFTINPTPIVELPEAVRAEMITRVQGELEMMVMMAGGDTNAVRDQLRTLNELLLKEEQRKAQQAAERLTEVITDRLHDAEWETVFIDFIEHFCIYPAAIMKAPNVHHKLRMKWDGNQLVPTTELVRGVECISPFDFYPAPYASDVQSADYVIERRRLTRNELLGLRQAPGYDGDAIDDIFEQFPNGSVINHEGGSEHPASDTSAADTLDRDVYDALGYYGTFRNDTLAEYGIQFHDDELTGASEAEVWVVGQRVIKCILNPDPMGRRPFYVASFERVPGAFWGISPTMKIRDAQKVCTATTRSLVRNMQFSSGPIGEVDKGRVKDGAPVQQIIPNTIRVVASDYVGQGPAYRFQQVPSHAAELMAIFDKFSTLAYVLVGLPPLAFGETQGLGTIGRTSGGVSLVMNQANKSIKYALRMLEKSVIEPVVQSFVDYEIRVSTDEAIKGDVRVFARGVSGLMEKESRNEDWNWALQSVSALAGKTDAQGQDLIPATVPVRILYNMFKGKGLPTEGIFPDFDKQDLLGSALGQVMPADPAGDLPQLDGRSATAAATIEASNQEIG